MIGGFQVGPFQKAFQQSGVAFKTIYTETYQAVNAAVIVNPSIEWVRNNSVPYSGVISVSPASGTTVPWWAPVTLQASLGPIVTPPTLTVPNVVGQQVYLAENSCARAGLVLSARTYVNTGGATAAMYVTAQSLTAGSIVALGTGITLTVAIS